MGESGSFISLSQVSIAASSMGTVLLLNVGNILVVPNLA